MEYKLTREGIDAASEEIVSYLSTRRIDRKEILRIRLGMEDTLLRYQTEFGEETAFSLQCGKSVGTQKVSVRIRGTMFDPFANSDEDFDNSFMRRAISAMGNLPLWRYTRGYNVLSFEVSRKGLPDWLHLLIAIVAALVLGTVLKLLPAPVSDFINGSIFSPLLQTFTRILSTVAGPMIFLAIVWGIYSVGDASTFSVLGKKLVGRFFLFSAAAVIICSLGALPFLNLQYGENQGGLSGFEAVYQMLLNIVPANIIQPLADGNTLQTLFLGVIVGLAMLRINEKTQTIAMFAEQLGYVVQIIMQFIGKFVPFFVFGSLLNLMLQNDFSQLSGSVKLVLLNFVVYVLMLAVLTLIVCLREKISVLRLWKKALPAFLIALTTGSSSAAFSQNLSSCVDDLGIRENLANFGVPFGQTLFKPGIAFFFISAALYTAEQFGITISGVLLISAMIVCTILSSATPPIPGGALASFSVLFVQLGLPTESLAVVLALNTLVEFPRTALNIAAGQFELILAADRFSLLDKEKLRS